MRTLLLPFGLVEEFAKTEAFLWNFDGIQVGTRDFRAVADMALKVYARQLYGFVLADENTKHIPTLRGSGCMAPLRGNIEHQKKHHITSKTSTLRSSCPCALNLWGQQFLSSLPDRGRAMARPSP